MLSSLNTGAKSGARRPALEQPHPYGQKLLDAGGEDLEVEKPAASVVEQADAGPGADAGAGHQQVVAVVPDGGRLVTQAPRDEGGEWRIRTSVGISRQIYSLLPLAARATLL